ncbi:hypothetical protein [Escherichia coli]
MPLAAISTEGATEWCAEYDEWGNLLNREPCISCSSLSCQGNEP